MCSQPSGAICRNRSSLIGPALAPQRRPAADGVDRDRLFEIVAHSPPSMVIYKVEIERVAQGRGAIAENQASGPGVSPAWNRASPVRIIGT
jgi:hypothetical protein